MMREVPDWHGIDVLLALVFALGLGAPAWCQALPPASTFNGDVRRGPDGSIVAAPSAPPAGERAPAAAPQPSTAPPQMPPAAVAPASSAVVPPTTAAIIVSNIHNAPGWEPNAHYSTGNRTVNGLGWTPGSPGSYTSGAGLNAYQLTSGACTSAPRGGPTGIGASISDGTCTWKYLSSVDYVSITGWAFDNVSWTPNTSYLFQDYVVSGSPPRAYRAQAACRSGAIAPIGTGTNFDDGGCLWNYYATITYSSQKSYIPTQRYLSGAGGRAPTVQMTENHTALLWNDREYMAGLNGENDPILLQAHNDFSDDNTNAETAPACSHLGKHWPHCSVDGTVPTLTLRAAPGESFRDNPNVQSNSLAYNPVNGVAIHSRSPHGAREDGSAVHFNDTGVAFIAI